jgi:hypothetical protein
VGTDVFLSHSKSGFFSNPPGWGRVYADLGTEPLSAESWQKAVRAGRTFATNGPWLELSADEQGPGSVLDVLDAPNRTRVRVCAHVEGPGVETLTLVGPEGDLATGAGPDVEVELLVTEPGWVAAVARGPCHHDVLGPTVFAHTSPVYIDLGGHRVARPDSARWCLDWLGRVEDLAAQHGNFADEAQLQDLVAVLDQARLFYRGISEG